jgi:hypothetical protein
MRRIICRTVCTAHSTTESLGAISHTFHSVVEKRNPYRSINRRQLPEPTPASLLSPAYIMSYLSRAMVTVPRILRMHVRHIKNEE